MSAHRTLVLRIFLAAVLLIALAAGISAWQWLSPFHREAQKVDITVLIKPLPGHAWTSEVDIPWHVFQAAIAAEDPKFFEHRGVHLFPGPRTHRGPTITTQLARSLLPDGSYSNMLVTPFLAWRIEGAFIKPEIIESYLNRIYLGNGYYGITEASRGYFGKEPRHLTIDEAATLAALIQSPNALSASGATAKLEAARNIVLIQMAAETMITAHDASRLQASPLVIHLKP